MRTRVWEVVVLAAAGALLVAVLTAAATVKFVAAADAGNAPGLRAAETLGGCETDTECEEADFAAREAVAFEREESRARARFAEDCAAGRVWCRDRRAR
jgi:hypothetical protein